ncbi:uncharacterized protein PV09_00880 [Verruconis gallopava]|uniref:Uncharacterized protein n=1 Tax=Verruconis gallopava TaxID=253628 RepID=A0A0D1Y1P3_9PEZI|nr:uncharacterized protein PV09_00880 [Verruconis gallopava]KIW08971.1 hypothetical protein PV09_00880 [Verruconis gallopava]
MPVQPTFFQLPMTLAPCPAIESKPPKPTRKPVLRLEIRDLSEEGARSFLSLLDCANVLENAVDTVISLLYTEASHIPPTRSITLILRSMPGVAYTTGMDIDNDHKEIHFSTDYVASIPMERRKQEMLGVITHEMVHCWQWAANGTCPGGLIEGIADFVRLRADFVPPHWKQEAGGDWDAGYQHTGYFLDWLERTLGEGTVIKINDRLRDRNYDEVEFWSHCCGDDVKNLWKRYKESLENSGNEEQVGIH